MPSTTFSSPEGGALKQLAEVDHHASPEENLCRLCQAIDFEAFFRPSTTGTSYYRDMGLLGHVIECSDCPFCRHIKSLLLAHMNDLETIQSWKWRLRRESMQDEEYLRASGISTFSRLSVVFKESEEHPYRPSTLFPTLKLLDGPLDWHGGSTAMIPTPITGAFRPSLLRSWLDAHREELNPRAMRDADGPSDLAERGLLCVLNVRSGCVVQLRAPTSYFALSYVWGGVAVPFEAWIDVPASEHGAVRRVNMSQLPRTIQDAANVVRDIGELYLWVDQICIDHKDGEHKAAVLAQMNAIYSNAQATIIAAGGEDSNAGLRRLHDSAPLIADVLYLQTKQCHLVLSKSRESLNDALARAVWNQRGWTYQEYRLSRTCVIFTDDEVFFNSASGQERECYNLVQGVSPSAVSKENPYCTEHTEEESSSDHESSELYQTNNSLASAYSDAVAEYSRRVLTHPGDRLDAFLGILNAISGGVCTSEEIETFSGLLRLETSEMFSLDWDWYLSNDDDSSGRERLTHNTLHTRALPSWSWVGWSGAISSSSHSAHVDWTPHRMNANNIRLDRCTPHLADWAWPEEPRPIPLGIDEGFVLHIWTRLIRACVTPRSSATTIVWTPSNAARPHLRLPDLVVPLDFNEEQLFVQIPCVGNYHRLMLVRKCENPEFVERVGITSFVADDKSWLSRYPFTHVKII